MNENLLSLDRLRIGEKGVVMNIAATESEKRRFWDLGLVHGTIVESLHRSPAGDPIAYFIMGAVIALRNCDAEKVLVSICI
jgi:ferrous iron transport protein A